MAEGSSVFDMIGPVMIGPSSSHTAGVVRIARTARKLFGRQPEETVITFYNSFASTYEGHSSDRAVVAGLLDFKTDDKRIREAFDHAAKMDLKYSFRAVGNASTFHPNTVQILMKAGEKKMKITGESRGGGVIRIKGIDDFAVNITAALRTLVVFAKDVKGSIANLANIVSQDDCNIATLTVSRKGKDQQACLVFEMDSELRPTTIQYLESLTWINEIIYIPDVKN